MMPPFVPVHASTASRKSHRHQSSLGNSAAYFPETSPVMFGGFQTIMNPIKQIINYLSMHIIYKIVSICFYSFLLLFVSIINDRIQPLFFSETERYRTGHPVQEFIFSKYPRASIVGEYELQRYSEIINIWRI